jgi:two-component system sensor histidine kinase TctE
MRIFQREQRSLFGEILDWMLTPLLMLWPVSLALTWLVAQAIADKPFDRALEFNVRSLAQLVTVQDGRPQFYLPQPAREILRADDADQIFYQVKLMPGPLLAGDRDLSSPKEPQGVGTVALRDDEIQGKDVRVASTWVELPVPAGAPVRVLVQVAEVAGLLRLAPNDAATLSASPSTNWASVYTADGFDPVDGANRVQLLSRSRPRRSSTSCPSSCWARWWC